MGAESGPGVWTTFTCPGTGVAGTTIELQRAASTRLSFCGIRVYGDETAGALHEPAQSIAVDKDGNPYVVAQGELYARSGTSPFTWTKHSSDAKAVAINSKNEIWKLGLADSLPYLYSGAAWAVKGADAAAKITVNASKVALVLPDGSRKESATSGAISFTAAAGSVNEASLAQDGTLYLLSKAQTDLLGSTVTKVLDASYNLSLSDEFAYPTSIAGVSSHEAWAATSAGEIFQYLGGSWVKNHVVGAQVAVGANGSVFALNDYG
jgi:hypothetical protein